MADDLVGCLSDNRANHYRFDKLKGRIRSAVWIAGVAQLVEQRIRNAKVVGSTPISGTTIPTSLNCRVSNAVRRPVRATVGQSVGKAAEWNAMRVVSLGGGPAIGKIRCGHW